MGDIPASLDNIAPSLAGCFADTGLLHLLLNFVRQIINFARQRVPNFVSGLRRKQQPDDQADAAPRSPIDQFVVYTDVHRGNRNMPNTAGELPLLALIGLLSLGAAAGTRVLARARSTR